MRQSVVDLNCSYGKKITNSLFWNLAFMTYGNLHAGRREGCVHQLEVELMHTPVPGKLVLQLSFIHEYTPLSPSVSIPTTLLGISYVTWRWGVGSWDLVFTSFKKPKGLFESKNESTTIGKIKHAYLFEKMSHRHFETKSSHGICLEEKRGDWYLRSVKAE